MKKVKRIKKEEAHAQLELLEALENDMGMEAVNLRLSEHTSNNNDAILGLDWSESAVDFNFSNFVDLITMEREMYYG